ncbi:P-loop containing nucleoside triphosphate hydrolase protein [Marasmius fiardii PR-910]|nr:P-loop containing nucleoside triphosphate hydrolase protein [Marasmius fiardii PR-910]
MDNSSEISSLLSFTGTQTSSSTVPGLGYLSGKAIKRFGEAVLNGVDNILVNRQLTRIEARFRKDGSFGENETEGGEMCGLLLELTHPGYPFPVQTRALCVIMQQIGAMNFNTLASTLVDMNSSLTTHRHLSTIIECLWSSHGIGISPNAAMIHDALTTKKIAACHAAGYEAYMAAFPNSHKLSIISSSSAFILYLAFITAIGPRYLARTIVELDITRFLELIGLFDLSHTPNETIAGRLLLHVFALKLDPIQDSDVVVNIKNKISVLKSSPPITPGNEANTFGSSQNLNDELEDVWTRLEASSPAEDSTLLIDVVSDAIGFIKDSSLSRNLAIKDVKALLLGSGESGKTTIMKQLILARRGSEEFTSQFPDESTYADELFRGVFSFLEALIQKAHETADALCWARQENSSLFYVDFRAVRYLDLEGLGFFVRKHTRDLTLLQSSADEATSYQLEVLMRITGQSSSMHSFYEPTKEDLLRWSIRTTGAYKETFETPTRKYHVWDCGGQRPERKKWIHIFPHLSDVMFSVMLYVASLVGYDQVLVEDGVSSRLKDALGLFDKLCHSGWFDRSQIVLVLTKRDCLTEERLSRSPLEKYFPDYTGGTDESAAFEYIKERFLSLTRETRHRDKVPVYVLNANRTEEVEAFFESIDKELNSRYHPVSKT